MVLHAHPTKLVLESIGLLWSLYFIWIHQIPLAIIFGLGIPLLGSILVWNTNTKKLAKTILGKLFLSHAKPFSLTFHILGYMVGVYGLWSHSLILIIVSVSLILFGHLKD